MGKMLKAGFDLLEESFVKEISSQAKIYTHTKSGARLLVLLNNDDNKVFCSSFKTPPEDDTGVAHIMEHSVLCGSKKYPVKEPFVELMKGSLNTFLNAMTYPDKTIYPVASRNLMDFRNLVDVYMDAVFFPELAEEAFEQEGWHHEFENDSITYKGVVFNEMKGVFSSPESYLDMATNRELFDKSTYRYESGGYPPAITDLSYESYLKFHKEKYHPANSWIILYGDLDEDYWLDYLDGEYLSKFSLPDFKLPEIISQPLLDEVKDIECFYPAVEETSEDQSLILMSFIVGTPADVEKNFAMGVLDAILIGSAGSPLKKALLESKFGKDTLDYGYSNETMQTSWSIGLRDSSPTNKDKFVKLVFDTLSKLCEEGIPDKIVAAAMNSCEFQLREANFGSYPKGLIYSMNIMSRWLYDGCPLQGLKYEGLLKDLKKKIKKGNYFESLIKEHFLENKNYIIATCKPDEDMGKQLEDEEKSELKEFENKLSEADKAEILKRNEVLLKRQTTPDSIEALATIPRVSVKDLNRTVERIPSEELSYDDIKYIYHDLPSQKVSYLHLDFDCGSVAIEDFKWLSLFNSLMIKCGTKDISYDEFAQDISIETGGISSTLNIYSSYLTESKTGCSLSVQGKAMLDKTEPFCDLLSKVLFEVDFSDLARIKTVIDSMISRLNNTLQNNGDRVAKNIISASLSATGYLSNKISSIEYLEFLKSVREKLNSSSEELYEKFKMIKSKVFTKANLIVNLACDNEDFEFIKQSISQVVKPLAVGQKQSFGKVELAPKENIGISSSGSVQYVAKGINFLELGYKNHGCFDLLNQLLSTGYLWEKVRVQGGAYGCYLSFDKISGSLVLTSYRDPNLEETIQVFDQIADYLENLEVTQDEFEKLIIGTVGRLDGPMTTSQKSKLSLNRYLAGVNYEDLDKRREELLNTKLEDLKEFAKYFRELAKHGSICVHGSETKIKAVSSMFDKILTVGD